MKLPRATLGVVLAFLVVQAQAADPGEIRTRLQARMPDVRVGAVSKTPYAGLYEAVVDGLNVVYTDEKAEVIVVGKLIELKTRTDLTEKRARELLTVDFAVLPLDKAIVTVRGDGSRKIALFSDPDCPYCQQLERELAGVGDVTIYTFLYPLGAIHPDAERKARLVWCAPDRAKAWEDLMLRAIEPRNEARCETPLREIAELARRLWIMGTPGIVFGSGRLVPGGLSRREIEQILGGRG